MIIFKKVQDISLYIAKQKAAGGKIGFVPTMGALHGGHASLISRSKVDGCHTVCSIFLNPTQFNDKKDLEQYPVSTESDIEMLLSAGCDVLFLPPASEIYPDGTEAVKSYGFGYLDTILEGAQRPGHFKGVGQVVGRLLEIVRPARIYMGQKDYQQCMVVGKLIEVAGMQEAELIICPTLREDDGLAMSSRNRRLTGPQRARAGAIYQCLVSVQSKKGDSDFSIVKKECEELLADKGFAVEYVALANARTLALLDNYLADAPMVALIAAKTGDVRLIDNMLL